MKSLFTLALAIIACFCRAQVPKLGNDTLLDVAAWNVEWFGNTANGPTNESLQYSNVKNLISQADFDIIAMEEMSNNNSFLMLSDALFAKYGSFNSTFQATQKMCLFYKKSMFEIIVPLTQNILTQYASGTFATRPPLQVALKTIGGNKTDTLYFIVVHLKAHTGSTTEKQQAYNKRKEAAGYIKTYIEQTLAGKKVIVLGDWNDDLNTSLYNNLPSPFRPLLDSGYFFATKQLTDAGKKSYAFGGKMIDHIMPAKTMDSFYVAASSRVFDNAGSYIASYSSTTSDHYPVYAFFDWKKLTTQPAPPNNTGISEVSHPFAVTVYPNPAQNFIMLDKEVSRVTVYDATGREQLSFCQPQKQLDISTLANGLYYLKIEAVEERSTVAKIVVNK